MYLPPPTRSLLSVLLTIGVLPSCEAQEEFCDASTLIGCYGTEAHFCDLETNLFIKQDCSVLDRTCHLIAQGPACLTENLDCEADDVSYCQDTSTRVVCGLVGLEYERETCSESQACYPIAPGETVCAEVVPTCTQGGEWACVDSVVIDCKAPGLGIVARACNGACLIKEGYAFCVER